MTPQIDNHLMHLELLQPEQEIRALDELRDDGDFAGFMGGQEEIRTEEPGHDMLRGK